MSVLVRVAVAVTLGALAAVTHGFGLAVGTGARTVELTIHHSRFVPSLVDAPAGTTVTFVVRNTDPIDHELIVGDLSVQRAHEVGAPTEHRRAGAVSVPAGSTRRTTYRFPAGAGGVSWFGCHLPGHWAYGMQGIVHLT